MHLLIIEHSHAGHRFAYLRMLLPALIELCDHITLAIPKHSVTSDEYRSQLAAFEDKVIIDAWLPTHSRWAQLHKPYEVREAVRRSNAEYLLVPHADGYAQIIGLLRSLGLPALPGKIEVEGLVMRGAFAYPQQGIKSSLRARASMWCILRGGWDKLHLIDPLVCRVLKAQGGAYADHLSLLPDPVPAAMGLTRQEARHRLGLPGDGRYVVAAGALDKRKGTDLLVRAFRQASLARNDRLLLTGKLAPEVRRLINSECQDLLHNGRLFIMDRFVSDEELNLAITAADIVCTPYRRHIGSASIAIRAAAANRFLLASDYGWLGHIVPLFGLGKVCASEIPAVLEKEIVASLSLAPDHVWGEAARRFVRFHSAENFAAIWTKRLREQLGKPPNKDAAMSWDEVLDAV